MSASAEHASNAVSRTSCPRLSRPPELAMTVPAGAARTAAPVNILPGCRLLALRRPQHWQRRNYGLRSAKQGVRPPGVRDNLKEGTGLHVNKRLVFGLIMTILSSRPSTQHLNPSTQRIIKMLPVEILSRAVCYTNLPDVFRTLPC